MHEIDFILALDSAMSGCGAAVLDVKSNQAFAKSLSMPRGQAEHLVPVIQDVIGEAGITYGDLGAIVTTIGPGAFTGLRIGLSAARSFELVLGIPIYGITTLQALALQYVRACSPEESVMVLIETKRRDYYMQTFTPDGIPDRAPVSATIEEIEAYLNNYSPVLIGDAVERFCTETSLSVPYKTEYVLPDCTVMAGSVVNEQINQHVLTKCVSPLYLRAPDVTLNTA